MQVRRDPEDNHLLASLLDAERDRIYSRLQLVPMPVGKILYEPGHVLRHVYFPIDCVVSLLCVMKDGASAEISAVGREGLVGIAPFMGGQSTSTWAVVQIAGRAYRLSAKRLTDEFHRSAAWQLLLLRYTQGLITQTAQIAACNQHHSVDQQLCRWLLYMLDRLPSNRLSMTQERIANTLGVRREGITAAAAKLQKLGAIRYSRGEVTVVDPKKLQQLCCECYAVVKEETDRLAGATA
jgi:CRP-like cAMP-binding protein